MSNKKSSGVFQNKAPDFSAFSGLCGIGGPQGSPPPRAGLAGLRPAYGGFAAGPAGRPPPRTRYLFHAKSWIARMAASTSSSVVAYPTENRTVPSG